MNNIAQAGNIIVHRIDRLGVNFTDGPRWLVLVRMASQGATIDNAKFFALAFGEHVLDFQVEALPEGTIWLQLPAATLLFWNEFGRHARCRGR